MGRHAAPARDARRVRTARPKRRIAATLAAVTASAALAFVTAAAGDGAAVASPYHQTPSLVAKGSEQRYRVGDGWVLVSASRDRYTLVEPSSGTTTGSTVTTATGGEYAGPQQAQAYAAALVASRGWDSSQFTCLVELWNQESSWNMNAENASSGAYGIPQALPGDKMGPGWQNDYKVQITWGLGYIAAVYGDPCGAWASEVSRGSY